MTKTPHSTPVTSCSSERERVQAECLDRINDARRITRDGLQASRQCLSQAVDQARSFGHAVEDDDGAELMEPLERLEDVLRSAQQRVQAQSVARRESVQRAATASEALRHSASKMARASASSRLVTLNALISAGHLGQAGAPLSVVATATGELAQDVRRLADSVSQACATLDGLLPELGTMAGGLDAHAEALFEQFAPDRQALRDHTATALDELHTVSDKVRLGLTRAIDAGEQGQEALEFDGPFEQGLAALQELVEGLAA